MSKLGLLGIKKGMTQVFLEDGTSHAVTVIDVSGNLIAGLVDKASRGYSAVVVGAGEVKQQALNKSQIGSFKKNEITAAKRLKEFRVDDNVVSTYELGQALKVTTFSVGDKVDVGSVSKGKGFAGAVKRWNFRTQDATHGNSLSHRAPGSIGQCQTPGRVFKGKKMAGQLGNKKVTQQNLEVIKVLEEKGLLLVKGAVPGATGAEVVVKASVKHQAA